jgi:uncharacterized membrane-anchored protein YjiN (DUF445 family)
MQRRATGLLSLMTAAFFVLTFVHSRGAWLGYARAGVEASMVGGLADWFAVTALFRRPLGLPIPHTAVIVERKDQFGRTLAAFVQQNFLSGEVLAERLHSSQAVTRALAWTAERDNAELAAARVSDLITSLTPLLRDDVEHLLEQQILRALGAVPAAQLASRTLRALSDDGKRQSALVDALTRSCEALLRENRQALRTAFVGQLPWWLPEALEGRIFDRLVARAEILLHDVRADPNHPVRGQLDVWVAQVIDRLETSPEFAARAEELKQALLHDASFRELLSKLSDAVANVLYSQAGRPDSHLRTYLTDALQNLARRLLDDSELRAHVEQVVAASAQQFAERFGDEIEALVSGTIVRWDAQQTSTRLELLLGRDLQFIRINGTLVGGLAGLLIHGVERTIG